MQFNFSSLNSLVKRLDLSKISSPNFVPPNLKGIQVDAYNSLLLQGLKDIISRYFPIQSASKNTTISLVDVVVVPPTISELDSVEQSKTYQNEVYLNLKLTTTESNSSDDTKVYEDRIFLGNMPQLSRGSNFIINGVEKFVISQIVRSPGAYILPKSQIKLSNSRKKTQTGIICELLPLQGVLTLFHLNEAKNHIKLIARNCTGDNAPQFPATIFLKAFGIDHETIKEIFSSDETITNTLNLEFFNFQDLLKEPSFRLVLHDIANSKSIQKLLDIHYNTIQCSLYNLSVDYYNAHGEKTNDLLNRLSTLSYEDSPDEYQAVKQEIEREITNSHSALKAISIELAAKYVASELGISTDSSKTGIKSYQQLLAAYFFNRNFFEMLPAGRYKLNHKLGIANRIYKKYIAQDILDTKGKVAFAKNTYMDRAQVDKFKQLYADGALKISKKIKIDFSVKDISHHHSLINPEYDEVFIYVRGINSPVIAVIGSQCVDTSKTINLGDIVAIFSYILNLKNKVGSYDDIDHLGNKRLRPVSELLASRVNVALNRIQKFAIDKMNNLEARINYFSLKTISTDSLFSIYSILNTKPFQIVVKEFFNSHQLTQFLDQQNPLSELTNKRKISAMVPGGIKREDPNLNIRDVHFSQYGRICPIETPEGMNIGLILALSSYAKIDEFGFLNAPFYKVVNKKITDEVEWLNPLEESKFTTVEAITPRDKNNCLSSTVVARIRENVDTVDASEVDYIDVSCNQLVSISSSLIPFLEHNDANRVLMGANMQRQALPLLKPYSPIVGTGVEYKIAQDSEICILAKEDGKVVYSDGQKIELSYDSSKKEVDRIDLIKFTTSNQNTCKNQIPCVKPGQSVAKGDVLVSGHAMQNGELALGQNLLVAFTTWHGYNFEDAIILSSRLYQDDIYTSIHIQEHTCECMRTKIGDEEITRQIPGVFSDEKKYLDEDGLIVLGAKVKEGDILVGKTSPKANTDQTPEEKLLQAIFSEKAKSVRDSSLRVPPGGDGVVSKILRFSIYKGDKLDDDVIEVIKVFVTQKRKIQVGDKMAGRHGNKGIVSKIAKLEDMPFIEDGTPVDILLNPLGVPSRMNIGQILETYLGFAARSLVITKLLEFYYADDKELACKVFGLFMVDIEILFNVLARYLKSKKISSLESAKEKFDNFDLSIVLCQSGLKVDDVDMKVRTPIFAGATREDLVNLLSETGNDPSKTDGKYTLFDGKTGEKFKQGIAVGVIYMLKLDHMVDDKIYARSVGTYSKITQQPLGGKAMNGGQRFGEMEVWALEAYGAAYNLQELLTIKSDDIHSRNSVFFSIVKNQPLPTPNIPESFKLLVKKLQAVGLKINVLYGDHKELISCHEFIEKQLNSCIDLTYDGEYQENLSQQLNKLSEEFMSSSLPDISKPLGSNSPLFIDDDVKNINED